MIKRILLGLGFFFLNSLSHISFSQEALVRIAVEQFNPPFAMRGANNQVYGFEVAMMQHLCEIMNVRCEYQSLHFVDVLNSVMRNQSEFGLAAITITPERQQSMLFSMPYLQSQASFIGLSTFTQEFFNVTMLNGKRIGVQEDTVFPGIISSIGLKNIQIKTYPYVQNIIDALNNGDIDIAMIDTQAAWYWQSQTANLFKVYGDPITYGTGLGIAISPQRPDLVPIVNQALIQYKQTPQYKEDYTAYLGRF